MKPVDSRQGYRILECQHCGERVPSNYDNAKEHHCGDGADGSPYSCCDEMELEDHWIEHDEGRGTTFSERVKKCQSCGEHFGLSEVPEDDS